MLERTIERHLVKRVKAYGAWAVKGENVAGFPDRIVLASHNRIAFVELKAPGGRVTPLQERMQRALRVLGFRVEVLWSKEEVDDFIEDFFE